MLCPSYCRRCHHRYVDHSLQRSTLTAHLKQRRIGLSIKEKHTGKLVDEWDKLLAEPRRKDEFDFVDCSPILSSAMASKDEDELVRNILPIFGSNLLIVIGLETCPHSIASCIRALGSLLRSEIRDNP